MNRKEHRRKIRQKSEQKIRKQVKEAIEALKETLPIYKGLRSPSMKTTVEASIEYMKILENVLKEDKTNEAVLKFLLAKEEDYKNELKKRRRILQIKLDLELEALAWKIASKDF